MMSNAFSSCPGATHTRPCSNLSPSPTCSQVILSWMETKREKINMGVVKVVVQFTPVLRDLHSLLVQSGITYKILLLAFNPLIPKSDQNKISPCNINAL